MNTLALEIKKCVLYCRVSTKEQVDEGNSLASQEKVCREYALKNGYDVAEIFIEKGESAKNADRTELKRLMAYCAAKKNNISAVIAYKIDRIARNIDDYRFIRVQLRKYGTEIKSTSEYFEDTPAGRFMENIIANVAQFDNDVRTERSVNGMRDAMREGRYVWAAPFGYINFANPKAGIKSNILPDANATVMRKLFTEIAKNEKSVDAIRRDLHSEGLATKKGKLLTRSHTYRLLNNETYAGWILKFGERHRGIYEPLISDEQFQQVQRILKRGMRRVGVYLKENPSFPLRRFVFHSVSGQRITGCFVKGHTKKYPYYRFIGVSKSDVQKGRLEHAFMQFMNAYMLKPEHMEYLKEALVTTFSAATEANKKRASQLRASISELYERQNHLIAKNEKGIIKDAVLQQQLDRIEKQLVEAHAELYKVPDSQDDFGKLLELTEEYLKNPASVWEKASFKTKVELQWFEFPKGVTFQNGKFRTTEIASIFKVKKGIQPDLSLTADTKGRIYEQGVITKKNTTSIKVLADIAQNLVCLAKILKDVPL